MIFLLWRIFCPNSGVSFSLLAIRKQIALKSFRSDSDKLVLMFRFFIEEYDLILSSNEDLLWRWFKLFIVLIHDYRYRDDLTRNLLMILQAIGVILGLRLCFG
jgi:hypothetical protein